MKFDQEDFYQLILKEQWTDILELLHTNKKIISSDPMLRNAAEIFEQEFFKKVSEYPIERKDIDENLETLLLLKAGRFFTLSSNNYKTLIIELVKRKPLKNAYDYAKEFPDEEICKTTINQYELLIAKEEGSKLTPLNHLPDNWIEIYNRLFELINIPTDVATYFSGPRFINTVREFEPYFPDYAQFIENRTRENKSTTRKIFYYDILLGIREQTRIKVVERILEILKPYQLEKVESIYKLIGRNSNKTETNRETESKKEEINTPSVFISYSWDDELHKQWVLELAGRLSLDGISVILDRYYLKPGKSLPHFVENSIAKANRIIIIFTPNYKLKADHRTGGAGYEYSIMNIDLYNNQTKNDKIIPVLRSGSVNESIPSFMQQFIHIDFQDDNNFENSYLDLLREIYNEPEIQQPQIGTKPIFKKKSTNEIVKPKIGNQPNFKKETDDTVNHAIINKLKPNDTPILTLSDGTTINVGTIRIEGEFLIHYTVRGLKEIFKQAMTEDEMTIAKELKSKTEEYLTENKYIARTPLNSIIGINR